jgi:hypothetical protein
MDILGNLITVFGTLSGIVVGGWLAAGRTYEEKIWDIRRQAYGVILSEIAMVNRIAGYAQEMMAQDSHRYFDSTARATNDAKCGEHLTKATQRFADDYLALSDAFIAIFEQLESEISSGDPNESWPEEEERFADAIKKARPLLTVQARSEVNKPPGRRFRWPFTSNLWPS